MKNLIFIIWLFIFPVFLGAKEDWNHLQFKLIDTENGLYNNQGRRIVECPDGQMLLGMEGMISVYNGCLFRNNSTDYQNSSFLNYFFDRNRSYHWFAPKEDEYVDRWGRLWIKDYFNLSLFDLNSYTYCYDVDSIIAHSGVKDRLKDFFLDEAKDAWLFTERGQLFYYDWEHPARLVYDGLADKDCYMGNVCGVLRMDELCYLFFKEGYMYCYNMESCSFVYKDNFLVSEEDQKAKFNVQFYVPKRLDESRFCLMACTSFGRNGIYMYDIRQKQWETLFLMNNLNDFAIDRHHNIWAGTNGRGLYIYRIGDKKLFSFKEFSIVGRNKQNNPYIYKVYIDSSGGVWLVTSGNGFLYYNENAVVGYSIYDELPETIKNVRSICRLHDGRIVIGGVSGVSFYSQIDNRIIPIQNLDSLFVMHMAEDKKGRLWISSLFDGLFCMDTKSGNVKNYSPRNVKGMTAEPVRFCYPQDDGSFLLCNGLNDLGYFYPDSFKFISFSNRFPQLQRFRTLVQALPMENDQLLVAAQNGMFIYDKKADRVSLFGTGALMPASLEREVHSKFNHIYRDSRGLWWIANPDGLNLYNPQKQILKKFGNAEGLPNSCIQTVKEDQNHDIWVATSCGLGRITLIEDKSAPEGYRFYMVNINSYDGALHGEYLERSVEEFVDGSLCFGGIGGMTIVSPSEIKWGVSSRKPTFVRLSLFNQLIKENGYYGDRQILKTSISQTSIIELKHNENFFSIGFSALNYANQSQTYFRYKLEGLDNDWTIQHSPDGYCRVSYTGVRPGKYVMCVYTSNAGFNWSVPAKLTIVIHPPLWETWWAYCIYVLMVIFIIRLLLKRYISRKRIKMQLEQEALNRCEQQKLDEMKFRFFTNISHEFRTPLTLIITPLEVLLKRVDDVQLHKQLDTIYQSARDLLQLVNQLLDFRRLEKKGEHVNMMLIDVVPFIEMVYQSFEEMANQRNIHYILENRLSSKQEFFYLDQDKVHKILNNLLSNAFKFTPDGGCITFIVEFTQDRQLRMSIADTGMGMDMKDSFKIFDRFYQARMSSQTSSYTGSGIGLHLVKEYIDMLHGDIQVESEIGKGSTFCITFPEMKSAEAVLLNSTGQKVETENMEKQNQEPSILKGTKHEAFSTTVLVVEDNMRFREFLSTTLSSLYKVLAAADGEEGLNVARNMTPDLIISDVMMPKMDGLELCRNLKSDIKTSHIPIILLTAKNTSESRTEGYEVGADSYITKPFSMDMLLVRIAKLLEQREKRHSLFARGINVSPKQLTINSIDEDLIARAMECMEKNMGNADYSVEALSKDVGMDRTHLYRKMQAIIGQTPSEFMRTVRLKRAANLLESGKYSVADVSLMVGFNTQKYFTNYFKEMFGVMPSAYRSHLSGSSS